MNRQALTQAVEYMKSWLQFRYEREEIPGFVVTVAHQGELVMNEAYGYANIEKQIALTPQHIFRIASHSKTFTATALMQLQEQKKLRIDDYVCEYLPWLHTHKDSRWQKVTLRQLMPHGAGVIRDGLDADYWQLERPFPTSAELRQEVLAAELIFTNNIQLKYSNIGYSLLGMVIEAVSGETYHAYVTNHIVNPLGLHDTGPEYREEIADRHVTGYTRLEAGRVRLPIADIYTQSMAAATGFYATAADLCRYFGAQFVGSGTLLDDESKKEMQRLQWHAKTPGQDGHEDYGLGIEIEYVNDRVMIGHGGGFPGEVTKTMADPKDGLVIVVLMNCLGGPVNEIATGMLECIDYFQTTAATNTSGRDMGRFAGRYMNLWTITDIIASGGKVVVAYPDTWRPLRDPKSLERLEYVDESTLKVTDTDSFYSEGELIHFEFEAGTVKTVNYNGYTMWPAESWVKKQASRAQVG